jgi:uncharacterized coiled-coil protein SlyX
MALNPAFLKTLAITPEGNCIRHTHISLLVDNRDEDNGASAGGGIIAPAIQDCECCWREYHERKAIALNQSVTDLTATSVSMSASDMANQHPPPPPAFFSSFQSASTVPAGNGISNGNGGRLDQVASVSPRWNQVQELGLAGLNASQTATWTGEDSSSILLPGNSHGLHLHQQHPNNTSNGHGNLTSQETFLHGSMSPLNPMFNMSMAAVAEEPNDSRAHSPVPTFAKGASLSPRGSQASLKRLEDQVQRQEQTIRKLQESVEHHEASIRRDLQHLIHLVTNLASFLPLVDSHENGAVVPRDQKQQQEQQQTTTPQRPSMYNKSTNHPSNMFTSVRTIERRPPKPPMRHGSFSTISVPRRQSLESTHISSIVSSLGTSTFNDATTYNDSTTQNTMTVATLSPSKHGAKNQNEITLDLKTSPKEGEIRYGPGLVSLLERERSQPLEIIFDASDKISTNFSHRNDDDEEEEEEEAEEEALERREAEEKKSGSSGGAAAAASRRTRSSSPTVPVRWKRNSFKKSPGSIRLEIPGDVVGFDSGTTSPLGSVIPGRSTNPSGSTSPDKVMRPTRTERKPPLSIQNAANRPLRQPRRELSVTNVTTEQAANNRKTGGSYPPPPPPPSAPSNFKNDEPLRATTRQTSAMVRLNASNLARLGASTAPPRREIFATGGSKLQISSLTIDTCLRTDNEPSSVYGAAALALHREVSNFAVIDKFGDKGVYTGTLRDEEVDDYINQDTLEEMGKFRESGNKTKRPKRKMVGIPHGSGTMKYEVGRFYKGEWRDGHWHGRGLLRNANGDSYEGDFIYDAR